MRQKQKIQSFDDYIQNFDRVFLSTSLFKNDFLTSKIVTVLKQSTKFKKQSVLINTELGKNKVFQNKFLELYNANLISPKMVHADDRLTLKPLHVSYKEAANNILRFQNLKLLLLTNDEEEAFTFLNLVNEEVHVKSIFASGFETGGSSFEYLEVFDESSVEESQDDSNVVTDKLIYRGGEKIPAEFFKEEVIKVILPQEGSTIFSKNKEQIVIGKKLGDGGEGTVYLTNRPNEVVKIIKTDANQLTKTKQRKLEQMVAIKMDHPLVVWPQDTVYTSDGKFVGFTMKNVTGIDLKSYTFHRMPNAVLKEGEININFINKVELCKIILSILDTIIYLHKRNIVIGDIKLENFMIKDRDISKIYFVDCDSYQIGDFPCILVSPGFKPPEIDPCITGKPSDKFRTFGNENFAIFSLLFHLIFRAKSPYTQQNHTGKDIADWERAKNGEFPYFMDKEKTKSCAPRGTEEPIWAHLPGYLKKAFINVGHGSGSNFGENRRLTPVQWQKLFTCYLEDLTSGSLAKVDPKCNQYHFIGEPDNFDYSVNDIMMSREELINSSGLTLPDTIDRLIKESGKKVLPATVDLIIKTLQTSNKYKDNQFEFALKINAGIFYNVDFIFVK